MKKGNIVLIILIILVLFCVVKTTAQSPVINYTLGWDYDFEVPDLAGFRFYQNMENETLLDPNLIILTIDPNSRRCVVSVTEGIYYWYLTAFDESGNESSPTNIVDTEAPPTPGDSLKIVSKTEVTEEITTEQTTRVVTTTQNYL